MTRAVTTSIASPKPRLGYPRRSHSLHARLRNSGHGTAGGADGESTQDSVQPGEGLVCGWNHAENDRIRAWFWLRYPFIVADDLVRQINDVAANYEVGIHCHRSATKCENEVVEQEWGLRYVERYRRLGLLSPNLYLVHKCWVTDDEIEQLKQHDVKIVHCPAASMHGAHGNNAHGMIPRMVARGVAVSLGTASANAGRFFDMVRVMYAAACVYMDVCAGPR